MAGRYPSLHLISRFQTELDRLFHEALQLGASNISAGEWQPDLDIVETPEAVQFLLDVPGLAASDLSVEVRGTLIVISGTKTTPLPPTEHVRFQCMERGHGRFRREVQLFWPVNSHRGTARLANGLLIIEFPKVQEKRQAARLLHIEEAAPPAETESPEA
jgi:HSP20 family protein